MTFATFQCIVSSCLSGGGGRFATGVAGTHLKARPRHVNRSGSGGQGMGSEMNIQTSALPDDVGQLEMMIECGKNMKIGKVATFRPNVSCLPLGR